MGWNLTTAMWRDRDPVTGQAASPARKRPGSAPASTTRRQAAGVPVQRRPAVAQAMIAVGFYSELEHAGFGDLGVVDRMEERARPLLRSARRAVRDRPRDQWVARLRGADIVSAPINTLLEASNDPTYWRMDMSTRSIIRGMARQLKVHGSPGNSPRPRRRTGVAPELGADNEPSSAEIGDTPVQKSLICGACARSSDGRLHERRAGPGT